MSLEEKDEAENAALEKAFLAKLREVGGASGNVAMQRALGWGEDRYWPIRNRIQSQGLLTLGRGRGGSINLVENVLNAPRVESQPVDTPVVTPGRMPDLDGDDFREGYHTPLGTMRAGHAEEILKSDAAQLRGRVQMVFTSPPFPLSRKKRYGNRTGEAYIKWLASFGPTLRDLLTPDGSIVLELGNAWVQGSPTMSTLSLKALLAFQEQSGLHLCQEFICYNPARLPAPAQWVTVERIRVKDAFTRVWWMSPTERPKADNRKVLTEYSKSMRALLKRGTYNAGKRPSQYDIGPSSFLRDNGGAIVPNVIVPPETGQGDLFELLPIANTRADDPYQQYCRKHHLETHPARMPERLVEFFVAFLTDPDDLVLDPFAGSNTTGAVSERLSRRWFGIEANSTYVAASRVRFPTISSAVTEAPLGVNLHPSSRNLDPAV